MDTVSWGGTRNSDSSVAYGILGAVFRVAHRGRLGGVKEYGGVKECVSLDNLLFSALLLTHFSKP